MGRFRRSTRKCPACGYVQSRERYHCASCGELLLDASGRPRWGRGGRGGILGVASTPLRDPPPWRLAAYVMLWLGMLWLGLSFVAATLPRPQRALSPAEGLLSMANLVFHEAGHVILGFFGDFVATLGGSLFQVGIPAVCALAFLTRHPDAFGAAACTWWTGQSLVGLAPYIYDARAQQLVLLGGVTGRDAPGYHDWNSLLGRLDLLEWDHALARAAHSAGVLLILAALAWGAGVLAPAVRSRLRL